MKDKIKSLFLDLHPWQVILLAVIGAVIITNFVTVVISYLIWHGLRFELILLGTVNAILVPVLILPSVLRMLRKMVHLEEQKKTHQATIVHLENQREIDATARRRTDEMALLYQLGISLTSGKNLYDTLLALQAEIIKLIRADAFYVALYDKETDIARYPIFFDEGEPVQEADRYLHEWPGLTGAVIFSGKTLYLSDMFDPIVEEFYHPHDTNDLVLHTFLGIPLKMDGQVFGMLSVQSKLVDAYTADQIQLMENIAIQAATSINKTRLLDQLEQELAERVRAEDQLREREMILESTTFAAEQFLKTPDWRANINLVLERLGKTLNVTHAYLFEDHIGPSGEALTSMRFEWTAPGYPSDLDGRYFQSSRIDQKGFEDQVAALKRGDARIGNASTFTSIEKEDMNSLGVKSILEVPIFVNGKDWGAIGFDDFEQERVWSIAEVEALKIAAGILGGAIQREMADSAVQKSERIYRQAIEAAGAVPYYQDYEKGGFTFFGEGIQQITGYAPGEVTPQVWDNMVQDATLLGELAGMRQEDAILQVRSGGVKAWKCDYKILTRDGQTRWVADTAVELFDEKEISYGSIGIMQDVTDRKQIEANLRQREAVLEAVTFAAEKFLKSPDWQANINVALERLGKSLDVTHTYLFEHHMDSNGEEVSSLRFEWTAPGFTSDLDIPLFQNSHPLRDGLDTTDEMLRRGEVFVGNSSTFPTIEKERLAELGVKAMVEVPLFVDGAWWGTIGFDDMVNERDWSAPEVDALKIAAGILSAGIQRDLAESAVRESERIYRQAISAAGAVPYYRDYEENRYTFMGEGIEQIIGYKPEEVTLDLWLSIMKENIPLGDGLGMYIDDAVIRSRTGGLKVWKSDMRILARNGEERWVTDSAVELFSESSLSYASVGILQDVTDRKLIEANLRKRESILEAITFAAEQFLKTSDWREKIEIVLEKLGQEFNASHAYLFEKHKDAEGVILSSMIYEWTAPGSVTDLDKPDFQNMPPKPMGFERMYEILDRGEPLIGSASFLNDTEREYLHFMGIRSLLEIRIVVNGENWGTIGFDDTISDREWSSMEVDVIKVAANVLGVAIKRQLDDDALKRELTERKLAEMAIQRQATRAEVLASLSQLLTRVSQDPHQVFDSVVRQCAELIGDGASIFLYSPENEFLELESVYNPDLNAVEVFRDEIRKRPIRWNEGAYARAIGENRPILISSVPVDELIKRAPPERRDYYEKLPVHSMMLAPLHIQGKVMGVIGMARHSSGRDYTPEDLTFLQDIADRAALAMLNAQYYRELEQELMVRKRAEQKYRDIFNNSIDGIFQSTDDGRFLSVNPAMARIYGYESPEDMLVGVENIVTQIYVNPEQRSEVRRRLASGERLIGYETLDYRKDGSVFWSSMSAQSIFDENGRILYYEGTVEDVTPRKKAEAEREALIQELAKKNAELEQFTYTVSHDLKSPLVTINGFLGYLEQDALSGNVVRLKKDMQRIQEAVHKMQRLLNELLELSRIGRMMNAPDMIPFNELVNEAVDIVHGTLKERGVTVQIHPKLSAVYGDRPRLVEVLQNLIDNSAKYMGDQNAPLIEIGQRSEDAEHGMPIFFVRDNGMGIAPEHHERVFGLFNKLDSRSEGTGVGLALVKRIIEVHGGRIWVESKAGMGSTFLFTLPASGKLKPDSVI